MNLESLVVFVLVLGVLVFFHEWGHFLAAKLCGVKVEEFAFGFGPKLLRLFKRGDTEYTIHAFPLGGFVKLTGMEQDEEDIPDGFQAQPVWKRAIVIFSGPLFSFILAVLVFQFIGIFWGFEDGSTLNKVLMVNPNTVASRIGLRAGDQVLEINGKKVADGTEMIETIHRNPGQEVKLLVKRNGTTSVRKGVPSWSINYLGANWSFMNGDQAVVGEDMAQGSEAQRAGVQPDDKLVKINGRKIIGGAEMSAAIQAADMKPAKLELLRKKQTVSVNVTPTAQWADFAGARWLFPGAYAYKLDKPNERAGGIKLGDQLVSISGKEIKAGEQIAAAVHGAGKLDIEVKRQSESKPMRLTVAPGRVDSLLYDATGLLGFTAQTAFKKTGLAESVRAGWNGTMRLVGLIFSSLAPSRIGKNVGGPLLIARQTSIMVDLGPYYVVKLGGMLSMSLAIINLFPIPLFDGGHLALLGVEAVRRRRLTKEQMQWVQMAGLAIIGLLVVTVFFSDITKILGGQVPQ